MPDYRIQALRFGFELPPLPGEDIPEAESYPTDEDMVRILASGTMVTTALLFGLSSFRGTGNLFGALGQAMENPLLTVYHYLREGSRIMRGTGDPYGASVAAVAEEAISRSSVSPTAQPAPETLQLASRLAAEREQARGLAREMIERRVGSLLVEAREKARIRARKIMQVDSKFLFRPPDNTYRYVQERVLSLLNTEAARKGITSSLEDPGSVLLSARDTRRALSVLRSSEGPPDIEPGELIRKMLVGRAADQPAPGSGPLTWNREALRNPLSFMSNAAPLTGLMTSGPWQEVYNPSNPVRRALYQRLSNLLDTIRKDASIPYTFKVEPAEDGAAGIVIKILKKHSTTPLGEAVIPIPDPRGQFRTHGYVFSSPLVQLSDEIIPSSDPLFRLINESQKGLVSPDQLAILHILGKGNKFRNELKETKDPHRVLAMIERTVQNVFRVKNLSTPSPVESLIRGGLVTDSRSEILKRMRDSQYFRNHIETGLRSLQRLTQMQELRQLGFAVDLEFVSSSLLKGFGLAPGHRMVDGDTLYEFSGAFVRPDGNSPFLKPEMTLRYIPQFSEAKELQQINKQTLRSLTAQKQSNFLSSLVKFLREKVGKSPDEVVDLLRSMQTGRLEIGFRFDNQIHTVDLFSAGGSDIKKLSTYLGVEESVLQAKDSESLEQYAARIIKLIMEKKNPQHIIGQNFQAADYGLIRNLFERAGQPGAIKFFEPDNVIDTLSAFTVMHPTRIFSGSLGSLSAYSVGLRDETEFEELLYKVKKILTSNASKEHKTGELKKLIAGQPEGVRAFVTHLLDNLDFFQGTLHLHTAQLDSFLGGTVALGMFARQMLDGTGRAAAYEVAQMLASTREVGGMLSESTRYRRYRFGDGESETVNPYLVNQEMAAWSHGSAINPQLLPLFRLQNPVRQLYQRLKPMFHFDPIEGRHKPAPFHSQARMPVFDPLRPDRLVYVDSPIFGGFGVMPSAYAEAIGGMEYSNRLAVETVGAMLPMDHPRVWGSQASMTGALLATQQDALRMSSLRVPVSVQALIGEITRTHKDLRSVFNLLRDKMRGPGAAVVGEVVRLYALLKSPSIKMAPALREATQRAIVVRLQSLAGKFPGMEEHLKQLVKELQEGSSPTLVRGRQRLISPVHLPEGQPLILSELHSTSGVSSIADVSIQLHGTKAELEITLASHSGPTTKNLFGHTSKAVSWGAMPAGLLGRFGEQFVVEAAFESAKRTELAGAILAQLSRIRLHIFGKLEALSQNDMDPAIKASKRAEILREFAEALSIMTGGRISPGQFEKQFSSGFKSGLTNRPELILTPEMERALENTSMHEIEQALRRVGLTVRYVSRLAQAAGMDSTSAQQALQSSYKDLANIVESRMREEIAKGSGTDRARIERLHGMQRKLQRVASGDIEAEDIGAFFDLYTDPSSGKTGVGYRGLFPVEKLEEPIVQDSRFGVRFEASTGRTLKKGVSSFSTVIMESLASFSPAGPGLGKIWQAYLASQSGSGQVNPAVLYRELQYALEPVVSMFSEYGYTMAHVVANLDKYIEVRKDGLYFRASPNRNKSIRIKLNVNPFKTTEMFERSRISVLGMLLGRLDVNQARSGWPGMQPESVLDLVFNKTTDLGAHRYSFSELVAKYGLEQRAERYQQAIKKMLPHQVKDQEKMIKETRSAPLVASSLEELYEFPFFSRKADLIRMRLLGGARRSELREIAKLLGKIGIDISQFERTLGAFYDIEHMIRELGLDPGEEEDIIRLLRSLGLSDDGHVDLLFTPTAPRPSFLGDTGLIKASVPRMASRVMENHEAIERAEKTILRIKRLADLYRRADPRWQNKLQQMIKREIEQFESADTQSAFGTVKQLFVATLRRNLSTAASLSRDRHVRHLGVQYKIARTTTSLIPGLQHLSQFVDPDAPQMTEEFVSAVKTMLLEQHPHLQRERIDKQARRAAESLFSYIQSQKRQTSNVLHWAGMGFGEGFISAQEVEKIVEEMRNQVVFAKRSGLYKNEEELRFVIDYVAEIEKSMKKPTGQSGMLMLYGRAPDFTQAAGYLVGNPVILHGDAIRALGGDPDKVNTLLDPATAELVLGDADGDLNFTMMIKDPFVAAHLKKSRMPRYADFVAGALLSVGAIDDKMRLEGSPYKIRIEQGRIFFDVDDSRGFTFGEKSAWSMLTDPGSALDAMVRGKQARLLYGLQKAVVGDVGGHIKRTMVMTMNVENAFMDAAGRLITEAGENPQVAEALQNALGDNWQRLQRLFVQMSKDYERAEGSYLLRSARIKARVLQDVAITKYKKGDALKTARETAEILRAVEGRSTTRYGEASDDMFERAFRDLQKAASSVGVQIEGAFATVEDLEKLQQGVWTKEQLQEELMRRAREGMRMQFEQGRILRALEQNLHITTDYLPLVANAGPLSLADEVRLATDSLDRQGGVMGATRAVQNITEMLSGRTTSSLQRLQQTTRLRDLIEESGPLSTPSFREALISGFRYMAEHKAFHLGALGLGMMALIAASGPDQSRLVTERYDTPSYRPRRSPRAREQMELYIREMQQFRNAQASGAPIQYRWAVPPPPTRNYAF
ncbi:MAG: hypothetical protein D6800_03190 [Candidatus Zixiibacteriota bacterium]|nr:MAG: hypothetical protein D6800_03190 [candidate division Zixibacteria bacterium]